MEDGGRRTVDGGKWMIDNKWRTADGGRWMENGKQPTVDSGWRIVGSVPELANLGGKQHPTDIIFPLFPSNFTTDFPLSSTENIIVCNNCEIGDPMCPSA